MIPQPAIRDSSKNNLANRIFSGLLKPLHPGLVFYDFQSYIALVYAVVLLEKELNMENCPCGSGIDYNECCKPFIHDDRPASTAEALLRSRYTAFTEAAVEYIQNTTHPDKKAQFDPKSTRNWAENSQWHQLEILNSMAGTAEDETGEIEFIATYTQEETKTKHHENAQFKKMDGKWFFYDGEMVKPQPVARKTPKIGRNAPCLCGSGKKYKKCCGK
jgi:SEC-C motif domain protein